MKTKNEQIFELSAPYDNPFQGEVPRVLFVCSAGILRSATGATVGAQMGLNTRGCGSHIEWALIPISVNLIMWADKIVFVNSENLQRTLVTFQDDECLLLDIEDKAVLLDIPDQYDYMHPVVVKIFQKALKEMDLFGNNKVPSIPDNDF